MNAYVGDTEYYFRLNRHLLRVWLFAGSLLISQSAFAAVCTISSAGVAFGSYDVFSASNLDGAGTINVSCDVSAVFTTALSAGGGKFATRTLASGPHKLKYNLYTDVTRTTIWRDGTAGTVTLSGIAAPAATQTVFGRIPATQKKPVGSYTDSIILTLTF